MRALAPAVLGDFWAIYGFSIGAAVKLRIGELTFDADTRQLVGAHGEVHLSPKAFELLKIPMMRATRDSSGARTGSGMRFVERPPSFLNLRARVRPRASAGC
jgi:hypothetical protein